MIHQPMTAIPYKLTTLSSGLRVLTVPMKNFESVGVAIWVGHLAAEHPFVHGTDDDESPDQGDDGEVETIQIGQREILGKPAGCQRQRDENITKTPVCQRRFVDIWLG